MKRNSQKRDCKDEPKPILHKFDKQSSLIIDPRLERLRRKNESKEKNEKIDKVIFPKKIESLSNASQKKLDAIGWTFNIRIKDAEVSTQSFPNEGPSSMNTRNAPNYKQNGILGHGKGVENGLPRYEFRSIYQYQIPGPSARNNTPWKQDPSIPPESAKPKILSVVASVSMGRKLDLLKIAENSYNLSYDPSNTFTPLVMRLKKPEATAMIFKSGKMVVTGTKSEAECKIAARRFARIIQKVGYRVSVKGLDVHNITASCNLGFRVRVHLLGADKSLSPQTGYHPELFTGVSIPLSCPRAKVMVFQTGSVLITGVKCEKDLDEVVRIIYPHAKLYAN